MSRIADPTLTEVVPLGKCTCPGKPHQRDEAVIRKELGASALARIGMASTNAVIAGDPFAYHRQMVIEAVESWNLLWLDPDPAEGEERKAVPAPVTPQVAALLDEPTLTAIAKRVNKNEGLDDEEEAEPPPNDSAVPSQESRQVRRSRTRTKTQKPGT